MMRMPLIAHIRAGAGRNIARDQLVIHQGSYYVFHPVVPSMLQHLATMDIAKKVGKAFKTSHGPT